jgi:hypothetical protein
MILRASSAVGSMAKDGKDEDGGEDGIEKSSS